MKTLTDAFTVTHLAWYRIPVTKLMNITRKHFLKTSTYTLLQIAPKLNILYQAVQNEIKIRENELEDLKSASLTASQKKQIAIAIEAGLINRS